MGNVFPYLVIYNYSMSLLPKKDFYGFHDTPWIWLFWHYFLLQTYSYISQHVFCEWIRHIFKNQFGGCRHDIVGVGCRIKTKLYSKWGRKMKNTKHLNSSYFRCAAYINVIVWECFLNYQEEMACSGKRL